MSKYTAEVERITYLDEGQSAAVAVVSVYGDLPHGNRVAPRTREALLRAARRVAGEHASSKWEVDYRVAVHNGQERHTVTFEPEATY